MKATEAKKMVDDYEAVSDISMILMTIKTLAEQGKRKMTVSGELTTGQLKALQELGYTIHGREIIYW